MTPGLIACLAVLLFISTAILLSGFKNLPEYERAVVFRLGFLRGTRGPGRFFVRPIVEKMVRVDLRPKTISVSQQGALTRDRLVVDASALLQFAVADPTRAVVKTVDYAQATQRRAEDTLRSVVAEVDLVHLMDKRPAINQRLLQLLDEESQSWGISVSLFEIKSVEARR